MRDKDQAEKLSKDAQKLLSNYLAMAQPARDSLMLLADGMAREMPSHEYHLISLFPRSWRPFVLRLLLFR